MKIIGGLITRNAEFFLKESISSYIDFVDKLIVVDDGSIDNTLDIVTSFGNKVELIRGSFKRNKAIQRQVYLDKAEEGDYIFCPDSDEVFTPENIKIIFDLIRGGKILTICIQHLNFWKEFDKVIHGHMWDQQMQRAFKKLQGTSYLNCHHSVGLNDINYFKFAKAKGQAFANPEGLRVHHYGYLKDKRHIWDKVCYYMRRDNPNCRKLNGEIDEKLVREYAQKHPYFSDNFTLNRYGQGGLYCCGSAHGRYDIVKPYNISNHPEQVKEMDIYKKALSNYRKTKKRR